MMIVVGITGIVFMAISWPLLRVVLDGYVALAGMWP